MNGKICVSIAAETVEECLTLLGTAKMAEIRLDSCNYTDIEIEHIFSLSKSGKELIATCREGKHNESERQRILIHAIKSGATLVDIEIESSSQFTESVIAAAKAYGCKIIISYHNFTGTPDKKELEKITLNCFAAGADIAKIACKTNNCSDAANILSLYSFRDSIVAIGMGVEGRITRAAAIFLGAPFTFASPDGGKMTAEGQMTQTEMEQKLTLMGKT